MRARPLLLVTGAPGSGKTTLVRRLARQALARGERPAIVVTELAGSPIDAWSLAGEGCDVRSVVGACPCCAGAAAIAQTLASLEARDDVTRIFVEAAWPADAAAVRRAVGEAAVVAVLDAQRLEVDPIPRGDVLLLNKADTRTEGELASLRARIRDETGRVAVATVEATIDLDEIERAPLDSGGAVASSHAPGEVVDLPIDAPLSESRLSLLLARLPPGAKRAKGFVRTSDGACVAVQVVARSVSVRRSWIDPAPPGRIVIVGRDLDAASLRAEWGAGP